MTKASEGGGYSDDCVCETCEKVRAATRAIGRILETEFGLNQDGLELDDLLSALVTTGRVVTKAFLMVEDKGMRSRMFKMWSGVINIDADMEDEPPKPMKSRIILQ